MHQDLRSFLNTLRKEGELTEITAEVNPYLEAAEIHRRVIQQQGPALLFQKIQGSPFALATNLFGTQKRIDLAFGTKPENFIRAIAQAPEKLLPPSLKSVWEQRSLFLDLLKVGLKRRRNSPVGELHQCPPKLLQLPLLTTWQEDGGPFVTLPLVYTEHPETGIPNLGMYRLQRFDDHTTGFHCQIGKGAGFHLNAAAALKQKLPVNVAIGGPPALILSAIAPLPENVPEVLLASLVQGAKTQLGENPFGPLPVLGSAEFMLIGEVDPHESRPEGPFGDHYGYYSLKHDYPVFRCKALMHRKNPICTATVVGKPRQEDFYLGDYLQELLSPLFPLVMPSVRDVWAYGETGYHSLAAAVVHDRYKREAMMSAFRILGEGQLSLTKFLLLTDCVMDLRDFPKVLEHILARADLRTDLYVFSNLSMDTLDYSGPSVNEGSKGVLLGIGDPIREIPRDVRGDVPVLLREAIPFCGGCLVISLEQALSVEQLLQSISENSHLQEWPLIVLVDDAKKATQSVQEFLWTTFTRFEPAAHLHSLSMEIQRNHVMYSAPLLIDARLKENFPQELECDPDTATLVESRWSQYFPSG